jgi:NADPH-dependent curcumin reductase CurA
MCPALAQYESPDPQPGPTNLFQIVANNLTVRGFRASAYLHRQPEATQQLGAWLKDGRLVYKETIVDGLERAPEALIRMITGDTVGKTLVRVAEPTVSSG